MKRDRDHKAVGDVLGNLLKINKLESGYRQAEVRAAWTTVVGETIANKTRSVRLDGATLRVQIDSGVVKEEFSLSKDRLLELLNEELKHAVVRKLEIY